MMGESLIAKAREAHHRVVICDRCRAELEVPDNDRAAPPPAPPARDPINHPTHYTRGGIETIDAIEAWGLGFHLGNAVKYISRAGHKGDALEDLKKARWYLDREISRREKGGG
jgi:hypothetical protein